jgi:hypothetical protein
LSNFEEVHTLICREFLEIPFFTIFGKNISKDIDKLKRNLSLMNRTIITAGYQKQAQPNAHPAYEEYGRWKANQPAGRTVKQPGLDLLTQQLQQARSTIKSLIFQNEEDPTILQMSLSLISQLQQNILKLTEKQVQPATGTYGQSQSATKIAQNYNFTEGTARAKQMTDDELRYALKDLKEVIDIQEAANRKGGHTPKLGYYWDEYHTYSQELNERRTGKPVDMHGYANQLFKGKV